MFRCFPIYKSISNQIWPLRKKVKGQPGVIIWINLVVLECPVLWQWFQRIRPFGSEEGFYRIWAWRPSCLFEQTFVPPSHLGSIWNLTLVGPGAQRRAKAKKIYRCVFQVSALEKLGMVGRHNILFCQNILYRNCIFQYMFPHFSANLTTFC